jgi:hypothetical protein
MREIICWYCEKETDINSNDFGVHRCNHCGVEIDVFNPAKPDYMAGEDQTTYGKYLAEKEEPAKEDKMPFDAEKTDNQYLKLPKEGEEYDFSQHGDVARIEKVANPDGKKGFNFVKKVPVLTADGKTVKTEEDQGYFYLITFVDGKKLTLSSWSPFYAMKEAGITEGVSFIVKHPQKGEWVVDKI